MNRCRIIRALYIVPSDVNANATLFLDLIVGTKDTDKGRLYSGRSSSEDTRAKSPLSGSKSSLFEKYSFSAGKTSERSSSVLDRYNRPASREKSREPEGISRYGSSTYPGSSFGRSYGNDSRIEKKDHPPPVSYRGLRPNSGRASREPSPEVAGGGKTNSFRVYSRAPSYGRSAASPSECDHSIVHREKKGDMSILPLLLLRLFVMFRETLR